MSQMSHMSQNYIFNFLLNNRLYIIYYILILILIYNLNIDIAYSNEKIIYDGYNM